MRNSRVAGKSNPSRKRKRIERKNIMNRNQVIRITQLTLAVVAAFTLTGRAEARSHSNRLIVVRPADLPELAQVNRQAILLPPTEDGRTILYIEQKPVAQ